MRLRVTGAGEVVGTARRVRIRVAIALAALVAAPLLLVISNVTPAAAAATITVDNSGDGAGGATNCAPVPVPGFCTLRDAFAAANPGGADAGSDVVINIPASLGTISLNSGELHYLGGTGGSHAMTLNGGGNTINQTTADARVIENGSNGLMTLTNLTVTGGNLAGFGGGIFAGAAGGVTLTNDTVTHNTATKGGGGIEIANGGPLTITGSTVSGNTAAGGNGAGVDAPNSTMALTNSTVTGNTNTNTTGSGGGLAAAQVTLVYDTVVGNSQAGGSPGANLFVYRSGSFASFASVIASPNAGSTNCSFSSGVTLASHGFNDEDDIGASCGFATATDDLAPGTSPLLGALANNGGPTQTMLPQDGPSPLIDGVPAASCQADGAAGVTTDQRGLARPDAASPKCDIGAVEVQLAAPTLTVAFTG